MSAAEEFKTRRAVAARLSAADTQFVILRRRYKEAAA